MQEIKIPEGCKASIDFEKRVVVIESEQPKFKKGDIVYCEYYDFDANGWIEIIKEYDETSIRTDYYAALTIKDKTGNTPRVRFTDFHNAELDIFRLATPSEQQLLFDALAKEGKKWNAEKLEVEDIPKDILVPESIGIYRWRKSTPFNSGDGLLLGFNNDKQLLGFGDNEYLVNVRCILSKYLEKIQCKLTPCKCEDLKAGDTAFGCDYSEILFEMHINYYKVLDDHRVVYAFLEDVTIDDSKCTNWYKVEPFYK